jgi:chaperonin GroES
MQISPLSDVVVIRRASQQEVSDGGIIIPPSDDFREDIGTIVFAGQGKMSNKGIQIPMQVKEGDKVLFSTNGHQITQVNGEELIVLRQDSIIGVIDD